jgi:hypothetical protein
VKNYTAKHEKIVRFVLTDDVEYNINVSTLFLILYLSVDVVSVSHALFSIENVCEL